jgi:hypothetical protein
MAETDEPNETPVSRAITAPCRHLRSNGIYIYGDGHDDAGNEEYSSSSCWCCETMKSFGPDDRMVGHRECRDATRSCYEPL